MDRKIKYLLFIYLTMLIVNIADAQQSSSSSSGTSSSQAASNGKIEPAALANSMLYDHNGDGRIVVLAFGDSLTRGTGDFVSPNEEVYEIEQLDSEAGYPLRMEQTLGISVLNRGKPGERLLSGGLKRYISTVLSERPDVILIMEGANDAMDQENANDYMRALQTAINVAIDIQAEPILLTLTPAIGYHEGLAPFINAYNDKIRALGVYNGIAISDIYQAFVNTCAGIPDCGLINRPEGLHPNVEGYNVIGEMANAAVLKVDILTTEGRTMYEQALYLLPGSIETVPGLR
ncbi:MAG: SGNH/GDSL hydrolase family protein [Deltaproteobacteria bacterium]|nr:SGNH/GDSL hydrolase family protein [Deltaproteobacteria bacterium]